MITDEATALAVNWDSMGEGYWQTHLSEFTVAGVTSEEQIYIAGGSVAAIIWTWLSKQEF